MISFRFSEYRFKSYQFSLHSNFNNWSRGAFQSTDPWPYHCLSNPSHTSLSFFSSSESLVGPPLWSRPHPLFLFIPGKIPYLVNCNSPLLLYLQPRRWKEPEKNVHWHWPVWRYGHDQHTREFSVLPANLVTFPFSSQSLILPDIFCKLQNLLSPHSQVMTSFFTFFYKNKKVKRRFTAPTPSPGSVCTVSALPFVTLNKLSVHLEPAPVCKQLLPFPLSSWSSHLNHLSFVALNFPASGPFPSACVYA